HTAGGAERGAGEEPAGGPTKPPMPTAHTTPGWRRLSAASLRPIQVRRPTRPPIAKVIAASWNAGIFPVATVITASSDHIRIAVNPISVAVRDVINQRALRTRVPGTRPGTVSSFPFCWAPRYIRPDTGRR